MSWTDQNSSHLNQPLGLVDQHSKLIYYMFIWSHRFHTYELLTAINDSFLIIHFYVGWGTSGHSMFCTKTTKTRTWSDNFSEYKKNLQCSKRKFLEQTHHLSTEERKCSCQKNAVHTVSLCVKIDYIYCPSTSTSYLDVLTTQFDHKWD
jgi:hypothetical protein